MDILQALFPAVLLTAAAVGLPRLKSFLRSAATR